MCRILILFFWLFSFSSDAIYKEACDFPTLQKIMNDEVTVPRTLVIFDCDDVLLEESDSILKSKNARYMQIFWDSLRLKTRLAPLDFFRPTNDEYVSIILRDSKRELLNPEWPSLISVLQKYNIRTLMLSSHRIGRFGLIPSCEELRYAELREYGLNFGIFWEHLPFTTVQMSSREIALFYEGIILTNGLEKGPILKVFLENIAQQSPSIQFDKVVFVDDKMENLESVCRCLLSNMSFVGIHYTYASLKEDPSFDIGRAQMQFDVLIDEYTWLSDRETDERVISEADVYLQNDEIL
jgi:hypothetical protein